jgi:hypothetical protein
MCLSRSRWWVRRGRTTFSERCRSVALLPRVGILDIEEMRRLIYLPVFFVAAAVSMGTVLEATKGLEVLTDSMFAWMQPYMTNIFTTT